MSLTSFIAISLYKKARSMHSTPFCQTLGFLSPYIYLISLPIFIATCCCQCRSILPSIPKSSNTCIKFVDHRQVKMERDPSNEETYLPIKFGHHRPDFVISRNKKIHNI